MNTNSYLTIAKKHLVDCEKYNIPREQAAFEIMHMSEDYSDNEVQSTFSTLPPDILEEVHKKIDAFKQSGQYHVISSTGRNKDFSSLMARLSKLI